MLHALPTDIVGRWVVTAALAWLGVATVWAQEPDPPSALEEVVVTARRVEESVQRVPIAITTYTTEKLAQLDVRDVTTLNYTVPGIDICCRAFNSGLTFVRGLQGSPTYFADAPVSAEGYANFFDINNVQVLKGPQGTLFGLASVAGAFVYEPRRPGRVLGGYLSASAGSYGRRTLEGAVDLPLVSDRLFVRLAAISNYRDGYIHDLSINRSYGDQNYIVLRPSVTWQITDSLENYTLFQYSKSRDNGQQAGLWVFSDANFNPLQPSFAGFSQFLNGGANYYALLEQMLLLQEQIGPYRSLGTDAGCATAVGGPVLGAQGVTSLTPPRLACPSDWNIDRLLVNTTTYSFNDQWSLKNIFAYNTSKSFTAQIDGDLTPLILLDFGNPKNTRGIAGPKQWSEELQLHGTIDRYKLTAGLFTNKSTNRPGVVYGDFNTLQSAADTSSESDSRAVYANIDVSLTDSLTLTVGARYNREHQEQTSYTIDPYTNAVLGLAVSADQPAGQIDYSNTSYTLGVQYQVTPGTMLFFTNSKGYSAGGFQGTPGVGSFLPQTLNNFEAGVKSTFNFGDMAARINASAYYGKFDDIQVSIWSTYSTPITGAQTVGFLTSNAAKATIKGVDVDLTLVPSGLFEFSVAVAYAENEYTQWTGLNPSTNQPFDYSSTPFIQSPKWKGNAGVTIHVPINESWGRIDFFANYSARTKLVYKASPLTPTDPTNPTTGLVCTRERTIANGYPPSLADGRTAWVMCVEPQDNLDLGAQWAGVMGHENVTLSVHATNVTGNTAQSSAVILDDVIGFSAREPAAPGMVYATLSYRF